MNKHEGKILLSHGNGGRMMHDLIENLFLKHFENTIINEQYDSAILPAHADEIAFTTDSFVIDPLFFPGGNIGKLAVCGTVNDLAVSGAVPQYISVSFILEEGFSMLELEEIVKSMAKEARYAQVAVVTGDTKVVNKGKCDKLFINTSGIGRVGKKDQLVGKAQKINPGDVIIINGTIGDHGMAVMSARESFNFKTQVVSDCASLNHLIRNILDQSPGVKFMRDPTRGGVATVLNELSVKINRGIEISEQELPVSKGVRAMCEILGFEPLHIANEGKALVVSTVDESESILRIMKDHPLGRNSAIIGTVVNDHPGKVVLKTVTGGRRIIDSLTGDPLPRIC
ncbi:MAG: hydrogenase expression/formation protein HypE [Bacteroidales bacterium]|nr:hydrogenase expression/formation protein HypE [Bacteroidales bacterium]